MEPLLKVRTVTGACIQRAEQILVNKFPDNLSAERAQHLCRAVVSLAAAYRAAGRNLSQVAFKFDGATILAVREPLRRGISSADEPPLWLTFLLDDDSSISFLANAASAAMTVPGASPAAAANGTAAPAGPSNGASANDAAADAALPVREEWKPYAAELLRMMTGVVGATGAQMMLSRVLREMGGNRDAGVDPSKYRELGEQLVKQIPNPLKRDALRGELAGILAHVQ